MPLSHLCAACGLDLSRIAAPPDPHYGLPVVVCPRCSTACVRSRGEWVELLRKLLRIDAWATALGLQIAAILILLSITIETTRFIAYDIARLAASRDQVLGLAFSMNLSDPFVAITAIICGWWLSTTFGRWHFPIVLLYWLLLLTAAWIFTSLMERPVGATWSQVVGVPGFFSSASLRAGTLLLLGSMGAVALWMLVGWPIGRYTRHMAARARRARFRWRRRAARRCRRGR